MSSILVLVLMLVIVQVLMSVQVLMLVLVPVLVLTLEQTAAISSKLDLFVIGEASSCRNVGAPPLNIKSRKK